MNRREHDHVIKTLAYGLIRVEMQPDLVLYVYDDIEANTFFAVFKPGEGEVNLASRPDVVTFAKVETKS